MLVARVRLLLENHDAEVSSGRALAKKSAVESPAGPPPTMATSTALIGEG